MFLSLSHDAVTCNVSGACAVDRQLLAPCQQRSWLHVALLPVQTLDIANNSLATLVCSLMLWSGLMSLAMSTSAVGFAARLLVRHS